MSSRESVDFIISSWKICGSWPISPKYPRLSNAYSIIVIALFQFLFPLGMFINLFSIDDISELLSTIVFLLIAMYGIKLWLIIHQKALIQKMLVLMDKMDEQVDCNEYRIIRDNGVQNARWLTKGVASMYGFTTLFLYCAALLNPERALIWSFWIPFDYQRNGIVYHIVLTYQMMGTVYAAFGNSSLDTFGGSLYNVLGSHFIVLGLRLAKLGHLQNDDVGVTTRRKLLDKQKAYRKKTEGDLRDCIDMHMVLIRFSDNTNRLLSKLNLMQFGISGISLCAAEYQLSLIDPLTDGAAFFAMLMYLLCLMLQIFVLCYYASTMTYMSDRLPLCIFYSNWIEQSVKFKSSMLIFAERSIKPIIPMAGQFQIGLPVFVSIMKSGYSMFACLKKLE